MLMHVSGDLYLKNDVYSISLCNDKGFTKFPTATVDNYYKPYSWHTFIHQTRNRLVRDGVITETFDDICDKELELIDNINSKNIEQSNFEILYKGLMHKIKLFNDCFMLTSGNKHSYHGNIHHAIISSYSKFLLSDVVTDKKSVFSLIDHFNDFVNNLK